MNNPYRFDRKPCWRYMLYFMKIMSATEQIKIKLMNLKFNYLTNKTLRIYSY